MTVLGFITWIIVWLVFVFVVYALQDPQGMKKLLKDAREEIKKCLRS